MGCTCGTLASVRVPRPGPGRPKKNPARLIADKAYNGHKFRKRLKRRGIELISPDRENAVNKMQDGRKLRRYKRRYIIERTNAWINTIYRRLTVRWDRILTVFSGFVHISLMMICLKQMAGF